MASLPNTDRRGPGQGSRRFACGRSDLPHEAAVLVATQVMGSAEANG
jgi:hypothetical protein